MQMVKIQIPEQDGSEQALLEIARRGRVDCHEGEVYMVPAPALELLTKLGVTFHELGRGGIDYAEKTLRDTLAAHAQRRPTSERREVSAGVP